MYKTFRCGNCNQRLFDVKGGEPRTAILIKCPRCGVISSFDYRPREELKGEPVKEVVVEQTTVESQGH